MVKLAALAGALLISAAAARADGFKAMSFGEGGGYVHPDPATQQFLDGTGPGGPSGNSSAAPVPASPATAAPVSVPAPVPAPAARPAAPRPAPAAPFVSGADKPSPRVVAAAAPAPGPGAPRRESMWNGVVRPLAVSPGVTSDDPDDARAAADSDYETRILGQASGPRLPRVAGPGAASAAANPLPAGPAASPREGGRLFVSLEIDPREAGTLRDAVAGLGASAGFAADGRFEPTSGPDGVARIAGWIPASKLGDALRRPGVRSVRVDDARPAPAPSSVASFLVGLRITDASRAREEVESSLRDMSSSVGFHASRVVGVETAPDGRSVALVEGRLSLSRLSAALSRTDVLRIEPLLPAPAAAAAATQAPAAPGGAAGFARFMVQHGLWLVLLTLLAALPSLREGAVRLAGLFNPYR